MRKKSLLITILVWLSLSIQLVFSHLPEEIRLPLLLTVSIFIIFLFSSQNSFLVPKKFTAFYGLYLLAHAATILFSQTPFLALMEFIKLLNYFGIAVIGLNLWRIYKNVFKQLIYLLIAPATFLALIGILEYTSRAPSEKFLPLFEPYHWPSLSASFFLLFMPITFFYYLCQKGGLAKIYLFSCLSILSIAWILTKQYLGLLLLFSAVQCLVHFGKIALRRKMLPGGEILNILLLILLLLVMLPNLTASFGTSRIPKEIALYQDQIYFQDKKDIARFAWESINKNFFTGIGLANFGPAYRSNLIKPWSWSDFASNELMQTLVESGILGFIAQLMLFTYLILRFARIIKLSLIKRRLDYLTLALSLLAFLILAMNNFSFRVFPLAVMFYLLSSYLIKDDPCITISFRKIKHIPLFIIPATLLILADGLFFSVGQRQFFSAKQDQSKQLFLLLSKRPTILLNPRIFIWLSAWMFENQDFSGARLYLDMAKRLKPYDKEIDYQIALIYYKNGEITKAKEFLLTAIERNWYIGPKYYYTLAKIFEEEKNLPLSLFWLKRASLLYPVYKYISINDNTLSILRYNDYLGALSGIYFTLYSLTSDKIYLDSLVMLSQ